MNISASNPMKFVLSMHYWKLTLDVSILVFQKEYNLVILVLILN